MERLAKVLALMNQISGVGEGVVILEAAPLATDRSVLVEHPGCHFYWESPGTVRVRWYLDKYGVDATTGSVGRRRKHTSGVVHVDKHKGAARWVVRAGVAQRQDGQVPIDDGGRRLDVFAYYPCWDFAARLIPGHPKLFLCDQGVNVLARRICVGVWDPS